MKKKLLILFTTTLSLFATDNLDLGSPSSDIQIIDREGYALGYSEEHEQPLWVSYKLTKDEVINRVTKCRGIFRPDSKIKTGSACLSDYRGAGYDRGHLAAASDMAWSVAAMSDSFYLSNISPQKSELNCGIWEDLENYTKNWAVERGHVYVITGPVIRPNYRTIGENKVTVPQWFYKIIYDPAKMESISFMIPNKKPQKTIGKFMVPIDKIEIMTGLDFLSNLDDNIENTLEKEIKTGEWVFDKKSAYLENKWYMHYGDLMEVSYLSLEASTKDKYEIRRLAKSTLAYYVSIRNAKFGDPNALGTRYKQDPDNKEQFELNEKIEELISIVKVFK